MSLIEDIDATLNETKATIKKLKERVQVAKEAGNTEDYIAAKAMFESFSISSKTYTLIIQQCKGTISNQIRTLAQYQQRLDLQRKAIQKLQSSPIIVTGNDLKH